MWDDQQRDISRKEKQTADNGELTSSQLSLTYNTTGCWWSADQQPAIPQVQDYGLDCWCRDDQQPAISHVQDYRLLMVSWPAASYLSRTRLQAADGDLTSSQVSLKYKTTDCWCRADQQSAVPHVQDNRLLVVSWPAAWYPHVQDNRLLVVSWPAARYPSRTR